MQLDRRTWLIARLKEDMNMDDADAEHVSELVLMNFLGTDEVDDDHLQPHIRSLFYELQDHRILTFRRFEYKDKETGRMLRGFKWRLHTEIGMPEKPEVELEQDDGVYANLPNNVWSRATPA